LKCKSEGGLPMEQIMTLYMKMKRFEVAI